MTQFPAGPLEPERPNQAMDQPHYGHVVEEPVSYSAVMKPKGFFHDDQDPRPHQAKAHRIRLASGLLVDPWDLKPEDVLIEDIAKNLSNETRYAGAAGFYSVGQHSLIIATYFSDPIFKVAALLHDSEEAYLKDMPSPVKSQPEMAPYKAAGIRARKVIFTAFGLGDRYDELMARVKPIDDEVYFRERASFAGNARPEDRILPKPAGWSERPFLREFNRWIKEIKK